MADYYKNIDKLKDECLPRLSYGHSVDSDNGTATYTDIVTLAEAKNHLKLGSDTTDDALVVILVKAAIRMCEGHTGINFTKRSVSAVINNSNGGAYLPWGPVGTITSVTDIDDNVLDSGSYKVTGVQFKQVQYPTYEYLKIVYEGGYTTCPAELKEAVLAQTLFLYENRGDSSIGMSSVATLILNPISRV